MTGEGIDWKWELIAPGSGPLKRTPVGLAWGCASDGRNNHIRLPTPHFTHRDGLERRVHGVAERLGDEAGADVLPEFCARALEERRELQELERKIDGAAWSQEPDHDVVFSSERDDLIDPVDFARTFGSLVQRAGVRRITIRIARKTCATLPAFLKVHPKVAQAIMRNSQIRMTMDVYTEVVSESEREAVDMLADLLEDPLIG